MRSNVADFPAKFDADTSSTAAAVAQSSNKTSSSDATDDRLDDGTSIRFDEANADATDEQPTDGVDDNTAIWFHQHHGRVHHFIGYYENSGEGVDHYVRKLKEFADARGYVYGRHYGPHDLDNAQWVLPGAASAVEVARQLGVKGAGKEAGFPARGATLPAPRDRFEESSADCTPRGT